MYERSQRDKERDDMAREHHEHQIMHDAILKWRNYVESRKRKNELTG